MNNYTSLLATTIQQAVDECIETGRGCVSANSTINPDVVVHADWCENESDMELVIQQGGVTICVFIEQGVAEKVWPENS